jgi:hypothetical protein
VTDSILDPTVEKFYAAVADLDSENVWEGAIKDAFAAIAAALPIPSDIDYALGEIARLLDALTETWDGIHPNDEEEDR